MFELDDLDLSIYWGLNLLKFCRKLVESPYIDSVEWAKWHVFWLDERVVPKDHEDSNYKLAYDGFLSKVKETLFFFFFFFCLGCQLCQMESR